MAECFPEEGMSGMRFIRDDAFHIKISSAYRSVGEGIKSVEFIRKKDDALLFVEAKTSFANPQNPESMDKFNSEINDICDKYLHSLNWLASVRMGVNRDKLPDCFSVAGEISLVLVLVIRTFKTEWCKPINAKLQQKLPSYFRKIWRPKIFVVSYDYAIKQGLAIANH
ncbi:hypothetical protein AGMMS49959_11040 [Planctomycetales bacterium]|nr:hypothetical protein AGMMS49959_11040 [Planctomycetales bacterium]